MTDDLLGYSVHFVFGGFISLMSWFFGGRDGFLMLYPLYALIFVPTFIFFSSLWRSYYRLFQNQGISIVAVRL